MGIQQDFARPPLPQMRHPIHDFQGYVELSKINYVSLQKSRNSVFETFCSLFHGWDAVELAFLLRFFHQFALESSLGERVNEYHLVAARRP